MDFVEVEEGGKIGEHLIPDPVAGLVTLLDLVDDVVRYFVVFPETKAKESIPEPVIILSLFLRRDKGDGICHEHLRTVGPVVIRVREFNSFLF